MHDLALEAKRPFGDGARGWTQNFTLGGREFVASVERHEAAEASAPHRKPAVWWTVALVLWEPQIQTVWKGRVGVSDAQSVEKVLRIAGLATMCTSCLSLVPAWDCYGSDWLVCESCVDDASPVCECSTTGEMAVVG